MTQQTINLGSDPNGIGGDTERAAFVKCNANFTELYATGGATSGSNSAGNWTKFADGTLVTWGRQVVNSSVPAGTASGWDSLSQPVPFVGAATHSATICHMTGTNGTGNALYSSMFNYNSGGKVNIAALNTGNLPSAAHPTFTIGTTSAASYFVDFQSIGRWK